MPVCDDVETIKRDIEKQIFFLNSIESIIYTNCTMNVILSPTIFQTNIYATNWTLGNLTIDDLIEQYYQRSIRYDNITNCPIEYPFFDGKNVYNVRLLLLSSISRRKIVMPVLLIIILIIHRRNVSPMFIILTGLAFPTISHPRVHSPCLVMMPHPAILHLPITTELAASHALFQNISISPVRPVNTVRMAKPSI